MNQIVRIPRAIAHFDISNKHPELLKFEQASGVIFTNELLKSRLPYLIYLRDIFVNLMIEKYSFAEIGEMINKDRTSIYNSVERFKYRYVTYSEYRNFSDEITEKYVV